MLEIKTEVMLSKYREGDMLILYKRESSNLDAGRGPTRYFVKPKPKPEPREAEAEVDDGYTREVLMESTDVIMLLKIKRLIEGD